MISTWSLLLPFLPPPGRAPPAGLTGTLRLIVLPLGRGTGGSGLIAAPDDDADDDAAMPGAGVVTMPGTGVMTAPGDGASGTDPVEALTADGALGAENKGVPRTVWAPAETGTGAGGELRRGAAGRSARLGAASVSACPTWSAVGLAAGSFDIIRPMRSHRTSGTPSGLPGFIIMWDLSSAVGAPVKGGTPQHIS